MERRQNDGNETVQKGGLEGGGWSGPGRCSQVGGGGATHCRPTKSLDSTLKATENKENATEMTKVSGSHLLPDDCKKLEMDVL